MRIRPALQIVASFLGLILAGAVAFYFAGFSESYHGAKVMPALFTATSAVCVTGLVILDTAKDLTFAGQVILAALIQLGGLGLLTVSTWVLISLRGRVSLYGNVIASETVGGLSKVSARAFLNRALIFTFLLEGLGALILFLRFREDFPAGHALWLSVFHSISAFCNAGFSLFSENLMSYRSDFTVSLTIGVLIILGGLGFIVAVDAWETLKVMIRGGRRRLSLHSRLALVTTAILIAVGAVSFSVFEWRNILAAESIPTKLLASLFLSVTSRTAGFNTVDTGDLTNMSVVLLILLMVIGASPASTGGGVKTTTAAIVWAMIAAQISNRPRTEVFARSVPAEIVGKAVAVFVLYAVMAIFSLLVLQIAEFQQLGVYGGRGAVLEHLFEIVSAQSTVGLSIGRTARLTDPSLAMLMWCMFFGRVGPLVLAAFLIGDHKRLQYSYPEGDVLVG